MTPKEIKLTKIACYSANTTMSVVGVFSPVLYLTFRSLYGISYSELGLLAVFNFTTQLIIDLIFSFFSHKFNIAKTVRMMPVIASVGFIIFSVMPPLFPNQAYLFLSVGTVIFSFAAGLGEVLISPVVAALPLDNPDREMSKLHSIYAWSTVGIIIFSTVFLYFIGSDKWYILALIMTLIPVSSAFLFMKAKIPEMKTPEKTSGSLKMLRTPGVWLFVFAIFLGGATECSISLWGSGYMEKVFGIPKLIGDIFGVAMFSVMLGLGRTLYAKIGKKIERVLTLGAIGAVFCYVITATTNIAPLGIVSFFMTGFCVSMLWPGSLVVAAERYGSSGVFIYAIMAAGGRPWRIRGSSVFRGHNRYRHSEPVSYLSC